MTRVPNDMSKRQRVPPRRNDGNRPADVEPKTADDAAAGGARARQPPWEKEAEPQAGASFGTWLRRQREARDVSLRDIADRTKISLRYLEAMEEDRFDLLPAPLFAKGFLREYARYVGLSPDEVVNHYLSVQGENKDEEGEQTLIRRRAKASAQKARSWAFYLFFVLVGLLLLGLVWFFAYYNDKRQETRPTATQPPPIAAPPAPAARQAPTPLPPPAEPAAPIEVTLDFTGDCWVEATIDGKPTIAEQRVQGESLELEAQQSIALRLGNVRAVTVQVHGQPLDLDTEGSGDVVRDLVIDLDMVRGLREQKEDR
jgi:cytoskeletal protein RodZ